MARVDDLLEAATQAVPASGGISYADLVRNLQSSGQADAVPLIAEAKRRGLLKASLEFIDGEVVHTYRRVEGGQ